MVTIFVTGGIGSGKSTLMRFFEAKGAGVVYADKVGHENLHNAAMKDELRAAFGNKIFDSEGEIVRSALAACAFSSPQNTALLDSITQPRLYEGCLRILVIWERAMRWLCLKAILDGRDDFYPESRHRYCGYSLSRGSHCPIDAVTWFFRRRRAQSFGESGS